MIARKKSDVATDAQPDPIDVAVGHRIKQHRLAAGVSQEQLGRAFGVSFQQFQKCEKGVNWVVASTLVRIGAALKLPVSAFFDGIEPTQSGPPALRMSKSDRV